MRLRLALDGRTHEVLVEGDPPETRVSLQGRTIAVRVRVSGDVAEAEVAGRTVRLEFGGGVRIDGVARTARVEWVPEDVSAEGVAQVVEVRPPMPGRVIRVLVQPGVAVRRGSPLVVLEAMKMHNEIPSPVSGIVREVRVKEGDAVTVADVLVRMGRDAGP
jgi:biotin carboxyl carrier protein